MRNNRPWIQAVSDAALAWLDRQGVPLSIVEMFAVDEELGASAFGCNLEDLDRFTRGLAPKKSRRILEFCNLVALGKFLLDPRFDASPFRQEVAEEFAAQTEKTVGNAERNRVQARAIAQRPRTLTSEMQERIRKYWVADARAGKPDRGRAQRVSARLGDAAPDIKTIKRIAERE